MSKYLFVPEQKEKLKETTSSDIMKEYYIELETHNTKEKERLEKIQKWKQEV